LKILIIHRYYWPDRSSCSRIIYEISKHLAKDNNKIDLLTSQPSYGNSDYFVKLPSTELINNIHIRRLALPKETSKPFWRLINAIHMGIWILLKSIWKKYDVIIATTIPPILGGFFSAIASKLTKSNFIYYCMDLNPEIGQVSKDFSNNILFKLLLKIDDWSCQKARLVLVHSKDMLKTLRARPNGSKYNIDLVNNFSPITLIKKNNFNLQTKLKKKLTIIYAGNIGRFQGLETMVDAMADLVHRQDIIFIIIGDGVAKKSLVEKVRETGANVEFFDYQPIEYVKYMIQKADICLVSLIPKIYKYSYPSKIMTYLEQGRPIICSVEKKSEMVKNMILQKYGFYCPSRNRKAMVNLLIKLAGNNKWKKKMNLSALKAFRNNFSSKILLKKWSQIIKSNKMHSRIIRN
jgi:glycosyltransferase involved in cell wall biosynthesis